MLSDPPVPSGQVGLRALKAMIQQKNILAALSVFHDELGDVFRISLPGFKPVMLVGPEANRFVLITGRNDLRWRSAQDPVTKLLGHGILVEDGQPYEALRRRMNSALHQRMVVSYVECMVRCTDQVLSAWTDTSPRDMLVEMRRIALLILVQTMFNIDLTPDLKQLWPSILRLLAYISPGLWLVWPGIPRPGYQRARQQIDDYLYRIIRARRTAIGEADDLLGLLVTTPGLSNDLIRDQLLTILIAGHDTSTALLAWTLYLLGRHPKIMARVQAEVDVVLGSEEPTQAHLSALPYLERVIKESLRLYPPIHLGTRTAAIDLEFQNYRIPAGTRILYSIYLTHRHKQYWPNPERFDPDRFTPAQNQSRPPFTFVPFGGGPRICLGFLFAQVEARVVLARILQNFTLRLVQDRINPHMGATLEPRSGVMMVAQSRSQKTYLWER